MDIRRFVAENLPLEPVPLLRGVRLHLAGPSSGIGRIAGKRPPYWAYPWSGGMALSRYVLDHPQAVLGRRVLDLGAGGGLVSIAAARAGAREVTASEIDEAGRAALELNLAANGVKAAIVGDQTSGPLPAVDVVAGGDIFYAADVATRMRRFLDRCLAAGLDVLIGDPGRKYLPGEGLVPLARYLVPEVGAARGKAAVVANVYRYVGSRP
jgi:predicted nicotinamide N-methyase